MAIRVRRVAVSSDQRCPLCRGDLAGASAADLAVCAGCDAVNHRACADELADGTCSTLGCGQPLGEAQVPEEEEVRGGERSFLVSELQAAANDLLLLVATGLVLFAGVLVGVAGVVKLRWPLWTMPVLFVGPLVLYGVWSAIKGLRAPRRRRPAK